MSIFSSIVNAIFGHKGTAAAAGAAPTQAGGSAAAPGGAKPAPMTRAQVEEVIKKAVASQSEDLNWRESIVDLMKALKLDSSLNSRKQLAQELGYTGQLNGSAEMNIWLHQQVMAKVGEGGGVVPDSLKHA